MASVGCLRVRGVCIAGKPGSYRLLLELACLRWRRWGACECAAFASRARPAPTGCWLACDGVGGCLRVRGVCIAGKPGSYRLLLELACLRWRRWGACECAAFVSRARPAPTGCRLACDGVGGVPASAWRLYRGQDPLLQVAGLPAMASVGCLRVRGVCIAGKTRSYRLARVLLELACLRWRRGVSVSSRRLHRGQARLLQVAGLPAMASVSACECAASASRASPAPTGCRLACDGIRCYI